MCEIARKTLDYKEFATKHSNPIGAPPIHPKSPPPKVITLCSKCLSEIGQGKPHQCYKTQKRENISEFVRSSSTKTTGQVTATGLKKVADEEGVSTRGGTVALSTLFRLGFLRKFVGPEIFGGLTKFLDQKLCSAQKTF